MICGDFDDEVFEWLSEGLSPSPPAHLRLLGTGGDELSEQVRANLRVVSDRLRERSAYWSQLIRARNWRPTLVGCSAVLLTGDERFLDDLLYRFREGSWVAPQLAVALGLVHREAALTEFNALVREFDASSRFKEVLSAYAVMKILEQDAAQEFETSELFRRSRAESPGTTSSPAYASLIAVGVVQAHWAFWAAQGSYGTPTDRIEPS